MNSATLKLCGLHLAANALLLWLAYEWLGVSDSTGARLVFSALDALLIVALVCWLYGATFVFFQSADRKLNDAFRTSLRHLGPLVVSAIASIAVYGLIYLWVAPKLGQPAFQMASWLTLHLRRPIRPAAVLRVFEAAIWAVRWIVLPVALLPMLCGIAVGGWRGFGDFTWRAGWRHWLTAPVLLAAGLVLPGVLLVWTPRGSFALELVSFSLRALAAYLLLVGSMVLLAARTALRPSKAAFVTESPGARV